MCFSATASLTAGTLLVTLGAFTLRNIRAKSTIPFACIPLLFGIQQLVEGMVWLSFGHPWFHTVATYGFIMFSHVLWPTFVPFSIWMIEKHPIRKKILAGITLVGSAVSLYLLVLSIIGPTTSTLVGHSIAYDFPVPYPLLSFALYFFATCAGGMVSSSFKVRVFGSAMLLGFFLAHAFYPETLFSVWCFFSAALSIVIYLHTKDLRKIAELVEIPK